MQILGKGLEHAYRILISIRRHGYIHLSSPDINAPGIRLEHWPIFQTHPSSLFPSVELARPFVLDSGLFLSLECFLFTWQCLLLFLLLQATAKSRK